MTVLTIRAQDTATAMDEIVEKLGKDSFIIGTKKIGNEILVKATNKPKKEIKPQKKLNQKFDEMISKELNVSSPLSTLKKDISTINDIIFVFWLSKISFNKFEDFYHNLESYKTNFLKVINDENFQLLKKIYLRIKKEVMKA